MTKEAMKCCASYSSCRAPVCPLESIYPSSLRKRLPGEAKCKARRSARLRHGKALKYQGLFVFEHNGCASVGGLDGLSDFCEGEPAKIEIKGISEGGFADITPADIGCEH